METELPHYLKTQRSCSEIDFNATLKEGNIPQNIRTALLKSDVKELQPDYLQKQLAEVKDDLEASVKK